MKKEKMITVSDIVSHLHKIANPSLAYDWDNVGLQIGNPEQAVKKILLTLDVTKNAVEKAINEKADLIISHHPIISKPIQKITNPLYLRLIQNNISVYCAHTNLDVVKKGVNFALAEKLGLNNLEFLSTETGAKLYHVAVYVPQDSMIDVANAVFEAGAGTIGNYTNCLNDYEVSGQFKPMEGSSPILGEQDKLEKVVERKLEFFVDSFYLQKVISIMKKVHPYETPAYAVYPQERQSENYGLGLIGNLKNKLTLRNFAEIVKKNLNASFVKLWPADKNQKSLIQKVAICGGNGSSLLSQVYGRADVFVSSGFNYHTLLDSKIPLIDAGHFYTEYPVLENLRNMLSDFDVEIMELKADEHEIRKELII
ncbi:MAG: Nif3-like dinuclear metal center hexameric protein [Candidatus Cloacimonetes bacterium]|nr:Nif3-like dinuclear metal center hexameric protein [Candidatus Cloacimonadota bacterium]MBL7148872.1 Nif3-like dinuclear metal center hexameric protein [Candidatus Cloacimonadota bacterium]